MWAETISPSRFFCGVFSRLPGRAAKSRKSTSPQQDPCCSGRAPALSVHHTEVTQLINRTACRPGTTECGLRPYPGSLQTGTGTLWTAGAKDGTPPLPTWLRRVPTRTAPPPTPFSPCGSTRASGRPGGASPPPSSAMALSASPAVPLGTASTRHVTSGCPRDHRQPVASSALQKSARSPRPRPCPPEAPPLPALNALLPASPLYWGQGQGQAQRPRTGLPRTRGVLPRPGSGAPLGVGEQLPLQPSLDGGSRLPHGQVCDERELVEDATAKVVGDDREAVIGTFELPDTKQQRQQEPPAPLLSPLVLPASLPETQQQFKKEPKPCMFRLGTTGNTTPT